MGYKPRLDLTGHRYGRWTVLRPGPDYGPSLTAWWCRCDCGTEKCIRTVQLRRTLGGSKHAKGSRSCGCLAKEVQAARITQYAYPAKTGAASHMVEKDGKTQSLKDWSKELGIKLSVLIIRWNRGWEDHEILRPVRSDIIKKYESPDPTWIPQGPETEKEAEG